MGERYGVDSTGQAMEGRELRSLLAGYRRDGAKVTREKSGTYRVDLGKGDVRQYRPEREPRQRKPRRGRAGR